MSDSDPLDAPRWPQPERRQAVRRAGRDRRRAGAGGRPASDERRQGDRRQDTDRRDESGWEPVTIDAADRSGLAEQDLFIAAVAAREFAQAHYSRFKVGAALETAAGVIVTGCNIENATYGLTVCAERVALFKALSEGHATFTRIVVVADTAAPTPPCGACRQLLWEYCGDIEVIIANLDAPVHQCRLASLLPLPFDRRLLH